MLTKRIIPCLDVDAGRVVKGVSFVNLRDAGDPVELAALYNREGADELVFYDITASAEGRGIMVEVVARAAEQVFIPLTVGGGLRSVEDLRAMLQAGADKVSLNSAAVTDPSLITRAANAFGNQCIVLSIDAKRVQPWDADNPRWEVFSYGGRQATGMDLLEWAARGVELGAGEIVMNSIDRDGTQEGYDLQQLSALSQVVSVPVIASGGAGELAHFASGIREGQADAVLAASLFHDGRLGIGQVKTYLQEQGIPVRVSEPAA